MLQVVLVVCGPISGARGLFSAGPASALADLAAPADPAVAPGLAWVHRFMDAWMHLGFIGAYRCMGVNRCIDA